MSGTSSNMLAELQTWLEQILCPGPHTAYTEHDGHPSAVPPLANNQQPFPALARDDHTQDTIQNTTPLLTPDTPDIDTSDVTWTAPGTTNANNARRLVVTRARGRQNGIIHTALLFDYLNNNNHVPHTDQT